MTIAALDELVSNTSAFPRILAIDHESEVRSSIKPGLDNLGFDVKVVRDARSSTAFIKEWMPEAILIDVRVQNIDPYSLVASLRRITEVPILMLSGPSESEHSVRALTSGADDYIAEQCDWKVLGAHIRARLRRPRMEKRDVVTYADVTIDVTQRKVARAGKPIDLSTREFELLLTFMRSPEQVFSRAQLLDLVWGVDCDVTQTTVDTYISYLRSKLHAEGAPLIHTLRGVGYTISLKRS